MRKCWAHNPEDRPSFRVLKEQLVNVSKGLLADWLALHARLTQEQQQRQVAAAQAAAQAASQASPNVEASAPCSVCIAYGEPWAELCRAMQVSLSHRHPWDHYSQLWVNDDDHQSFLVTLQVVNLLRWMLLMSLWGRMPIPELLSNAAEAKHCM